MTASDSSHASSPSSSSSPSPSSVEFDASKGLTFERTTTSKWMTEKDIAELPLTQRINWLSTTIIFAPLLATVVGAFFVPLRLPTLALAVVQYLLTGLGITGGYHRLWSHRSYEASWLVELVLAFFGAAAFEGSARWWCRNHRAHHRYVDTDKDPYAVEKGFWYAHVGWMVLKQDRRRQGRVDISDLNQNKILKFQHRYYLPIAVFFAFVLPVSLAAFCWGDFWGGLVYAGFARMLFVHQSTFFVNSLAHTFGEQTYSTDHTSYDSVLTALLTLGEGYHNYHHEFPHDYRNGVRWFQYDPTKWCIRLLSWFSMTWHLVRFPRNEMLKARMQVQQQKLDERKMRIDWGKPLETLPEMTWDDIRRESKEPSEDGAGSGRVLIVIEGIVHDCTRFASQHPGGRKILEFWTGRDATQAFNGEVYAHTKAARNLSTHLRVARLREVYDEDAE